MEIPNKKYVCYKLTETKRKALRSSRASLSPSGRRLFVPSPSQNMQKNLRADHDGPHRVEYEKNRRKILATQDVCGICGKPVDKALPWPHPMSACIDHIIPIDRGGHPSALGNLQLAHMACNRQKSNKIVKTEQSQIETVISNRILPWSTDWKSYRSK